MVRRAEIMEIEQIIMLDESVIGSRNREGMILNAVENGHCYVIAADGIVKAFSILNNSFYGNRFIINRLQYSDV